MGFGSLPQVPEWLNTLARWYRKTFNVTTDDELRPADTASDLFLTQWNERAQRAYNTYGESVGMKNFAGAPMPSWPELPRRIRAAWCLATQAVFLDAKVACTVAVGDELRGDKCESVLPGLKSAIQEIP